MNYRHAFHAGNFADCMKHTLLVWLLQALGQKPAPFFALDTHAGAGRYDLTDAPSERTGEWKGGIGRLLTDTPQALYSYVGLVRRLGLYPGSPAIIRGMLRERDRLACCEKHPEDALALRRLFARDRQAAVHRRDGWEALGALLPPRERRGLVLIDPPYEQENELGALTAGLRLAHARFRTGVFAAWYPIKHRAPVRLFHTALLACGIPDMVTAELWLREPVDPGRLNGCGLLLINPPFKFETEAEPILRALLDRLGDREPGEGFAIRRLTDE
jgi:23S rRNA (adenine2030-N6)-methyltransferase